MSDAPSFAESGDVVADLRRFLRANTVGLLRYGELVREARYVLDEDGEPVTTAIPAMFEAGETILFIPNDNPGALELLVTLESLEENSAASDRWRIYHGQTDDPEFVRCYIEAARKYEYVIDGDAFRRRNPLTAYEPALCRIMNRQHPDVLHAIAKTHADVEIESPRLVGVDSDGLDIRARFSIVRVPFERSMETEDAARSAISELANQAGVELNWESS